MKLKRVELQGFKSFVDKTVLEFDAGITAILGPNCCGKSNIVDAIRWVLGEQSAKQLRGTVMEDIIFKGTARRKPVGLCEVALTFTNDDRALPIEFDEVAIKRRVTRDGNSQYFLNDSPVRLKDLRDLFFDSGVNNTAYSVIEQEKIGRVLAENSSEVRVLIEEGAGIVRYKARRKEAQRKLDQTEQDLLRLRDITEEIGREVRSLQRQVGKARRYQRLYGEVRALDLLMADKTAKRMDSREHELKERLSELKVLSERDAGELAELRARIESVRPAVDEREAERHGLQESLQAYETELRQVEQKVLLLEHRITDHKQRLQENTESVADICRRREGVHSESHELGQRRESLSTGTVDLEAEVERLEEELRLISSRYDADRQALETAAQMNMEFIETDNRRKSELRELEIRRENRLERQRVLEGESAQLRETRREDERRLEELTAARDGLSAERRELLGVLADAERTLQDVQDERSQLREEATLREARIESFRSRHELLKRIKDSFHGYGAAAREVLQRGEGDPGVLGSLADSFSVDPRWNEAFEALLGDTLDSVLVDGAGKAVDLVNAVREAEKGRASFLLADAGAAAPDAPGATPAGGLRALDLATGRAVGTPYLRALLGRTWLFETDELALGAAAAHAGPGAILCVSHGGLLVSSDGLVRGGRGKGEEVSLLGRGDKLDQLEADMNALTEELVTIAERRTLAASREEELKGRVETGRAELEALDERVRRVHVDEAEARSRLDGGRERLTAIARDVESIEQALGELAAEETRLRGHADESDRQRSDSHTRVDELRRTVTDGEQERDRARQEVSEKRLLLSRRQGEVRELGTALQHLQESAAEMTATEERLRQEIEMTREELGQMETEIVEFREKLEHGLEERERRRLLVQASSEAISTLHEETSVWVSRAQEIEDERNGHREEMHGIETELATMEVRKANLVERIEEQYKGRFRELVRSFDPEALPRELEMDGDVFQAEQAEALLENSRRKLDSLGAVNHLAIEEYEQKRERLTFLEEQLADVEKAREDLIRTIDKINRTAKQLFHETYEEVRRNYIAVFQTLFEGGRADLVLERTDDPLESAIRIVAQPKGKRVDHIRLLSGGERCLTALSLLFAVYLVKPSPFCLLDEADAPLDDANVQRFVRMLREFSVNTQFLVVTHNKLTMETANHLYGVTMMEEGVSNLVSVSFRDVAETTTDAALGDAIAARRRHVDETEEERAVIAAEEEPAEEEHEVRFVLDGDEPRQPGGGEGGGFAFAAEPIEVSEPEASEDAVETDPHETETDGAEVAVDAAPVEKAMEAE